MKSARRTRRDATGAGVELYVHASEPDHVADALWERLAAPTWEVFTDAAGSTGIRLIGHQAKPSIVKPCGCPDS